MLTKMHQFGGEHVGELLLKLTHMEHWAVFNTLVSNPQNCRLPVYVSFLFAPPRMSNSSLFVLIRVASNWGSVQLRPYSSLFVPNRLPGHRNE